MKRVFISFDYDNDLGLKNLLVGQSKNDDSPFEISDWSVKEHLTSDWKEKVKEKMKKVDVVAVICGEHAATGVNTEVGLAQDVSADYFLLAGRKDGNNKKPSKAKSTDKMYKWTWDNLKLLIEGNR